MIPDARWGAGWVHIPEDVDVQYYGEVREEVCTSASTRLRPACCVRVDNRSLNNKFKIFISNFQYYIHLRYVVYV